MLFNSLTFLIFLLVSFFIYWFVVNKRLKARNLFLLITSYIFYGWWDWKFLTLIVFSSLVDYLVGLKLVSAEGSRSRKLFLYISLLANLGLLAVFKYYNFFAGELQQGFQAFNYHVDSLTLDVILPVGISFYTFQTLSYTIDIYHKKIRPTKDLVAFFAFVSFFPQLVAGPIERASHLLPQFFKKHTFEYDFATSGVYLILWGLFKKVVIADNCAMLVNQIFGSYSELGPLDLFFGLVFFAFQIYGDFSGYSDIAIGTARLFGFDLMNNFQTPYFSRNIAEFWRKWHISLTTWFRDYVYIPLGGNRVSQDRNALNIMIVFVVSGLWHGANWTFIFWGGLNGLLFLPLVLTKRNKVYSGQPRFVTPGQTVVTILKISLTFLLLCITWLFFRAETISDAFNYFELLFRNPLNYPVKYLDKTILAIIGIFVILDWYTREEGFDKKVMAINNPVLRRSVYCLVFLLIFFFGIFGKNEFIYFQF